ncbi:MAG: 50S ribosomal protein L6 [Patescibacteria group bacterium]
MSRIGKKAVLLPAEVKCKIEDSVITLSGSKGTLVLNLPASLNVVLTDGSITLSISEDTQDIRSLWGLYRTKLANALTGVSDGFIRGLELSGVGYRAKKDGEALILTVGFSHPVKILPPESISFSLEGDTKIKVHGLDKQLVGEVAAKIRAVRPPEPYKGKGIKYAGEILRKKAGKAGKVGTGFGAK